MAHLCFLEIMDFVELLLEHARELGLILVCPVAGGGPVLQRGAV